MRRSNRRAQLCCGLVAGLALLLPVAAGAAVTHWEGTLTLTVDMAPIGAGTLEIPLATSGPQTGSSSVLYTCCLYDRTASLPAGGLSGSGTITGSVNTYTTDGAAGILPTGVSSASWNLQNTSGVFSPYGAGPGSTQAWQLTTGSFLYSGTASVTGPDSHGGSLALSGTAQFYIANGNVLSVPLGAIGRSDAGFSSRIGLNSTASVRVYGTAWTTGTVVARGEGSAAPDGTELQASGYDDRIAGGSGTLQLVTPFLVHISSPANKGVLPGVGVLNVRFSAVPEPGTALLLGSGVAGLALLGRQRWRG